MRGVCVLLAAVLLLTAVSPLCASIEVNEKNEIVRTIPDGIVGVTRIVPSDGSPATEVKNWGSDPRQLKMTKVVTKERVTQADKAASRQKISQTTNMSIKRPAGARPQILSEKSKSHGVRSKRIPQNKSSIKPSKLIL